MQTSFHTQIGHQIYPKLRMEQSLVGQHVMWQKCPVARILLSQSSVLFAISGAEH